MLLVSRAVKVKVEVVPDETVELETVKVDTAKDAGPGNTVRVGNADVKILPPTVA